MRRLRRRSRAGANEALWRIENLAEHHPKELLRQETHAEQPASWRSVIGLIMDQSFRCFRQPRMTAINPDFAIGQNRQDARRGRCRCMRILRTSRNAADCPFSTIPKGVRIGCFSLQMRLSHFGAKDGQLHCISTCLRAARHKYLPILKRKIRDKMDVAFAGSDHVRAQSAAGTRIPGCPAQGKAGRFMIRMTGTRVTSPNRVSSALLVASPPRTRPSIRRPAS